MASGRVMLVAASLAGGGIARTVATLANAWVERDRQVSVLTFDAGDGEPAYALDDRTELHFAELLGESRNMFQAIAGNVRRIARLRRRIAEIRPDVVVSFGDQTNVLVLLALIGTGIPVIVSERIDPRRHRIGRAWSLLRRVAYILSSRIVVQTDGVQKALARHLRRKAVTIPNPVPIPHAHANPERNPTSGPVVIAMGRLNRQKGFDVLLEAFARVAPDRPEWSLVIWGEGPARAELEEKCRRLGLSKRARLAGLTGDPESELASASLFVLSSRYEGFPNALCEAMAVGLPVVATDCDSGPADIVRPREDGLLVPVEDVEALAQAMNTLMGDPSLRERYGRAAQTIVERFSVPRVLAAWEGILPAGS